MSTHRTITVLAASAALVLCGAVSALAHAHLVRARHSVLLSSVIPPASKSTRPMRTSTKRTERSYGFRCRHWIRASTLWNGGPCRPIPTRSMEISHSGLGNSEAAAATKSVPGGTDLNDPLIWMRALHFAATASLAGALLFKTLISDPAVRTAQGDGYMAAIIRRRLAWIVWLSFAFVLVTGAGWFVVQTAQMTDVPPSAVFTEGAAWNVLLNTDFGNVWAARAVLAALFAGALVLETGPLANVRAAGAVSTALAVPLAGALAFAGHAAAGSDTEGAVHLSADILHLVAAAAWLGALLPLAMLLSTTESEGRIRGCLRITYGGESYWNAGVWDGSAGSEGY